MKLERNDETYQIVDKTIEELNKDLEEIDLKLGILRFSQKVRGISATFVTSCAALNTFFYVKNNQITNAIVALLFVFLASIDIRKSKINDQLMDELYEQKDLLNEAKDTKIKKLTR